MSIQYFLGGLLWVEWFIPERNTLGISRNTPENWPYLKIGSLQMQLRIWRWEHPKFKMDSISKDPVLIRERRGKWETQTQRGKVTWNRRSGWSNAAINQGMPRVGNSHQKLAERHETVSPSEPQEGTNAANIWISDFWCPELWENKFLLFEVTKFAIICDESPRILCIKVLTSKKRKETKTYKDCKGNIELSQMLWLPILAKI